jgi:prefoldin alpha subunit
VPENKASEEDVQKKMLQFQILEGNLRAVRGQLEQAIARLEEMGRTKLALEDLGNVKPNDSAMVPIGAGTFVRGKITDSENVLVSLGTDMAVLKKREDAVKFIEERTGEFQKAAQELMAQEKAFVTELQRLQPEIQRMLQG